MTPSDRLTIRVSNLSIVRGSSGCRRERGTTSVPQAILPRDIRNPISSRTSTGLEPRTPWVRVRRLNNAELSRRILSYIVINDIVISQVAWDKPCSERGPSYPPNYNS